MRKKINQILLVLGKWLPLSLWCYLLATLVTIGVVALAKTAVGQLPLLITLQVTVFAILLFLFRRTSWWQLTNFDYRKLNWWLLILGGGLMLTRGLIYFNALDDFTYHLPLGYYSYFQWQAAGTTAVGWGTLLPLWQMATYPLIASMGIRLTLLLIGVITLVWWASLNYRLAKLWQLKKEKRLYLNLLFIIIYFLPELVSSQMLLMSDFLPVVLAVEGVYIFWRQKGNYGAALICGALAFLIKQSTGLFVLPIFLYYGIANWQKLRRNDWLMLSGVMAIFATYSLRSYQVLGTPTPLLNSVFQSLPVGDWRDERWGATTLIQNLFWSITGYYQERFIEFLPESMKWFEKIFFTGFLSLLYLGSLITAVAKKRTDQLVIFVSFLLWSLVSGFGRYRVGVVALAALLLFRDWQIYLPKIKSKWLRGIFYLMIGLFVFRSARFDYAFRYDFFLQNWRDQRIIDMGILGHDRYDNIEAQIELPESTAEAIVLTTAKGPAEFYAFILEKKYGLPVYKGLEVLDESALQKWQKSARATAKIKGDLTTYQNLPSFILLIDDFNNDEKSQSFIAAHHCQPLARSETLAQFNQHPHYFSQVGRWLCGNISSDFVY